MSFGPDRGVECKLWVGEDCVGDAKSRIGWPGTGCLSEWGSSKGGNAGALRETPYMSWMCRDKVGGW